MSELSEPEKTETLASVAQQITERARELQLELHEQYKTAQLRAKMPIDIGQFSTHFLCVQVAELQVIMAELIAQIEKKT